VIACPLQIDPATVWPGAWRPRPLAEVLAQPGDRLRDALAAAAARVSFPVVWEAGPDGMAVLVRRDGLDAGVTT
jgi:hypothetical protein